MLKLKEYREAAGISQAELARRVGISRSRYNNYELGVRTADYETLLKLADELGCAVSALLDVETVGSGFAADYATLSREEILSKLTALSDEDLRRLVLELDAARCTGALAEYLAGASSVNKSVKPKK